MTGSSEYSESDPVYACVCYGMRCMVGLPSGVRVAAVYLRS